MLASARSQGNFAQTPFPNRSHPFLYVGHALTDALPDRLPHMHPLQHARRDRERLRPSQHGPIYDPAGLCRRGRHRLLDVARRPFLVGSTRSLTELRPPLTQ